MIIEECMSLIFQHVRETETCSYPYLVNKDGKLQIAVFTYMATEEPITIFGYDRVLTTDGESIDIEDKELFKSEDEFIYVGKDYRVDIKLRNALFKGYCEELQNYIDRLEGNRPVSGETLRKIFTKLIPEDAFELYRRICPGYLEILGIEGERK